MSAQSRAALDVRDLAVTFPGSEQPVRAVDSLTYQLRRGETLAIVGESGSGKTVSALALMGLIPRRRAQTSGSAVLDDEIELLSATERQMQRVRGKRIGMIFQEPMTALNPLMTVGRQITETLWLHGRTRGSAARATALEMLDHVGLPDPNSVFHSFPFQLSGGMRQRSMIAMALAPRPNVLIADEPTTALDVTVQRTILELIADLKDRFDLSILLITHDLGVVSHFADRALVMHEGKAVERAPARQLIHAPRHAYTRALVGAVPSLSARPAGQHHLSRNTLLAVQNATKTFGASRFGRRKPIHAVRPTSLNLRAGETLGIVGESGSGKTTLGRMIAGFERPSSGSIMFGGQNILTLNARALRSLRRAFQMVHQDPHAALNPRLSVFATIDEPLQNFTSWTAPKRRQRVLSVLEQVGLDRHFAQRRPGQLSGGQKQRVCIARAIVAEPQLLIADEPTSALDVKTQAQIMALLARLKTELSLSMVLVSHDIAVVAALSDRIAVMRHGQIVEIAETESLLRAPSHPYTRELLGSVLDPFAVAAESQSAVGECQRNRGGSARSRLGRSSHGA